MKRILRDLAAFLLWLSLGACFGWLAGPVVAPFMLGPTKPPATLYECPCEASEVVNDVVRHTNKKGMSSVTTFIDVKDCLIVKSTK
jgi:hypothetical protein